MINVIQFEFVEYWVHLLLYTNDWSEYYYITLFPRPCPEQYRRHVLLHSVQISSDTNSILINKFKVNPLAQLIIIKDHVDIYIVFCCRKTQLDQHLLPNKTYDDKKDYIYMACNIFLGFDDFTESGYDDRIN